MCVHHAPWVHHWCCEKEGSSAIHSHAITHLPRFQSPARQGGNTIALMTAKASILSGDLETDEDCAMCSQTWSHTERSPATRVSHLTVEDNSPRRAHTRRTTIALHAARQLKPPQLQLWPRQRP